MLREYWPQLSHWVSVKKKHTDKSPSEVPSRKSQRTVQHPDYYGCLEPTNTATNECADSHASDVFSAQEIAEPATIDEALESPHVKEKKLATDSEYTPLMENDTWDVVELPGGRTVVGCKWVFKVKHNGQGKAVLFKSRLVAKGYTQKHGIDFEETFSPIVHFSSIRTLLALAIQKNMIVHQMDVVTAFFNGKLNEEIYMQQPDGY